MSPVVANQTQDKLGSATPQTCHNTDCVKPRDGSTMGTLFELPFGGCLPSDLYSNETFASFGPPVDFDAGFVRLDAWKNDQKCSTLGTPSASEMPDLSSQSSSPYSSRPTSVLSQPQDFSFYQLTDQEPRTSRIEPRCVDYSNDVQWQSLWTGLNDREFSPFPTEYSLGDTLHHYELPPAPAISGPLENFRHGKAEESLYSMAGSDHLTGPIYPSTGTGPRRLSIQIDLGREDPQNVSGFYDNSLRRCPAPNCGKGFRDLKAHFLTHVKERPEKCPVFTCDYSIKGFCRKYDRNRHTLAHYRGTMICSFCPVQAPKTFERADIFKRHLTSIHGAEHATPSSSRKGSKSKASTNKTELSEKLSPTAKGICSICLVSFGSVQYFYNHLDDCVIKCVMQQLSKPDGSLLVNETIRPDQNRDPSIDAGLYSQRNSEPRIQVWNVEPITDDLNCTPVTSAPRLKRRESGIFRIPDIGPIKLEGSKVRSPSIKVSEGVGKGSIEEMLGDVSIPNKRKSCILMDEISAKQMKIRHEDLSTLPKMLPNNEAEPSGDCEVSIDLATYIRSREHDIRQDDDLFKQWLRELEGLEDWKAKGYSLQGEDPTTSLASNAVHSGHSNMRIFSAPSTESAPKDSTHSIYIPRAGAAKQRLPIAVTKASSGPCQSILASNCKKFQNVPCKEQALEEVIKEEADMVLLSRYEPKSITADVPPEECRNYALSPDSDLSKDISDQESISDCSTDWSEDQFTSTPGSDVYKLLDDLPNRHTEGDKSLLKPLLSPMKQDLVDRIMTEFWSIVNQEWTANLTKCAGETPTSSSPPVSNGTLISDSSPQMTRRKRQRDDGEDFPSEDNNGRNPKRPNSQSERSLLKTGNNFACPYRKHDPHRYTIYNHRSCALSHWDSVARVKEHLYRRHRVPVQCKRCWQTFKTDAALDAHLTVVNICALRAGQVAEGLTSDQEKRLKSRKKSSPDQSEEARWKEIYGVLFPNEVVPNPYFEPVQENMPQSPDSRDLADYEEYSRQELPRYFRSYLENAVNDQTQHLEEDLRSHLVNIVQDCQARIFSDYRMRAASKETKPTQNDPVTEECTKSPASATLANEPGDSTICESKNIISSVFAPTPETTLQSVPDMRNLGTQLEENPECAPDISFSDSAYSSCPSGSQPATLSFEIQEPTDKKTAEGLCDHFMFKDGEVGGDILHELSFEEFCNINIDMNDQDFSLWANPDHTG